jgi:predicted esterase
MNEADFSATMNQLRRLYEQGDYSEALGLLERVATRFPQQGLMYHWKMCLSARAGRPSEAIQVFQDALDHGYWYPKALIREDEDLQSLQGMPEYEELVTVSLERAAELGAGGKPELLVVPPDASATGHAPLLIGLHGNSQNARLAADDWRELHQRGWMLALPQSSEPLTADAYMWDDFDRGAAEVEGLCAPILEPQSVDSSRIILGGFSAGGGLAIRLALAGTLKARGFLVIGPYLRDLQTLTPYLETARNNGIRGYIVMGLREPDDGRELMSRTTAYLRENGIPCVLDEHADLGHAFPPDFPQVLDKALDFLLPFSSPSAANR